jgi:FSR family fosmidomycin resistance protein-like MFS transporter
MWLLPASIVFTGIFAAAVGFTTSFAALLAAAILLGLGSAVYHPLGSVAVNKLGGDMKGFAISLFSAGGHFGYALAPVIGVTVVGIAGFRGLGYLVLPALVVALLLYQQRSILELDTQAINESGGNVWAEIRSQFRPLATLNLIAFLRSWAQLSILALLPWYLMDIGFSEVAAGQMLTPFLLAGSVGGMVGGYVADRFSYRPVIAGSLVATAGCLLLLLKATSPVGIWVALLLLGTFLQAMVPVSVVMSQELIPNSAGMASGMMLGLVFGLGGIGVTLTTYFSDLYGATPALSAVIPLFLIAAVISLFLPEKK